MKKITLIIGLAIMLINLNANGQKSSTDFGVKAGLNYSSFIKGNDIPSEFPIEFNGKIGFHIGGFFKLGLTEKLKLKPELLFSMQGAEYEISLVDIEIQDPNDPFFVDKYKVDIKESLILLPIMLDYYLNEKFDIEFGPQLGFVISHKTSDNNETFNFEIDDSEKFEIGLNLGLGYNFSDKYRIGLRYNYGIMERDNRKSSVFQIGLEYKIK